LIRPLLHALFGSDLLFWGLINYFPAVMMRIMGVPGAVQKRLSVRDKRAVDELARIFLPMSRRADGILNDMCFTNPDLNELTLAGLLVPLLMLHARDDPWGSHEGARKLAGTAPIVEFVEIEDGGHLINGHIEAVRARIGDFVRANVARQQEPS
jgi:pimeloyl-ACP methyl ester carboxylesterase